MNIPSYDRLWSALSDRYVVGEEVGRGGMATVYLARDLRHERDVALKVMRPELAATVGSDRFLREIRIAAGLHHPHILQLYDSGDEEGFLYYVMPFVSGHSLSDRLAREGELPVRDAARILRDVADALAHAHRAGLVHRDVKPGNIMLHGRHAIVTDFGVAKAVDASFTLNEITAGDVALGTPAYMAPEQAAGSADVDHRADIYSLGCVGYAMLTGSPPFTGGSVQQVLRRHVTEEARPIVERRPAVPEALDAIVMRCLAKHPADRWQSADEIAEVLEILVSSSDSFSPASSPVLRIGSARRASRRVWLGAAFVAVAALATGFWLSTRRSTSGPTPAPVQRQLTFRGDVEDVAATRDGQFVAYTARSDSGYVVRVLDVASRSEVEILSEPDLVRELDWSADGRRLKVQGFGDESWLRIYPRLGGDYRQLEEQRLARWMDDGDHLYAFATNTGRFVIRPLDAAGVKPVRGLRLLDWTSDVRQSADGDLFVVASRDDHGRRSRILAVSIDDAARLGPGEWRGSGAVSWKLDAAPFLGRRLRWSGALKATDPESAGSSYLLAAALRGTRYVAGANTWENPPAADWSTRAVEFRAPEAADSLILEVVNGGTGAAWADAMKLEVEAAEGVWETVPIPNAGFEESNDSGRPTGWSSWGARFDDDDPYEGSRAVRLERSDLILWDEATEIPAVRWSPTARDLYYVRGREGSQQLWKLRVDAEGRRTGDPVMVINELEAGPAETVAFTIASEGRQLFYRRGRTSTNLWTVRRTGDRWTVERLTSGTAEIGRPERSPDGSMLAYVARVGGRSNVWQVPVAGGQPSQLTHHDSIFGDVAWSPDGESIAVLAREDDEVPVALLRVSRTGTWRELSRIPGAPYDLFWDPLDGIVVGVGERSRTRYARVDPEDGSMSTFLASDGGTWLFGVKPSPDGAWIGGAWNRSYIGTQLWAVSLTDSTRVLLRQGSAGPVLGWSPIGDAVYALDAEEGTLLRLEADGSGVETLTRLDAGRVVSGTVVSDDHFVVVVDESQRDVWVIDDFDPDVAGRDPHD